MAVGTPVLEAYALTKSRQAADGERYIWRSPDIVVEPGQFVTVLGDQSSDAMLLSGMLSTLVEPSGGVLRIGGEETRNWSRQQRARLRARRIGFLFREPKLLPELSVLANVALPQRTLNIPRTILFVAWAGAEQHALPDFTDMLEARVGFRQGYRIAAVIELNGVGAGTSPTLLLERSTSARLTEVLQQAARRSKVKSQHLRHWHIWRL